MSDIDSLGPQLGKVIAIVSRLSIVIPVRGNLGRLEDTLLSVLENRPEHSEIIVVLDEPYDDPYDLKDELSFVEVPRGADWSASVNVGVQASRGPILHVVACGALVEEGWADAALVHFADPWVATVAPLVVEADRPDRVLSAGLTYDRSGRQRALGQGCSLESLAQPGSMVLAADPAAGFYRKSALELVGGFSSIVGDDLATIDLGLRLAYAGFRTVCEPRSVVCGERRERRRRGAFRRALAAERLFWRWAPSLGWLLSLPLHALTVVGELLVAVPRLTMLSELTGRVLGLSACFSGLRHQRNLRSVREAARAAVSAARAPHFAASPSALSAPASGNAAPKGNGELPMPAGKKKAAV